MHYDREKVFKIEALKQRAGARSRAEAWDASMQNKGLDVRKIARANNLSAMDKNMQNDQEQPENDVSTSFASFLKTKAKKAYQFGEGLVKSITNQNKLDPNVRDKTNREPTFSRFEISSAEKKAAHNEFPLKSRPAAISMQLKEKVSLKDYYEQGPITPKKDEENSLIHMDVIDTQVMNIEADFEQLDIGEEPIFERNAIKNSAMNIFKDKMAVLSARPALSTFQSD